MAAIYTPQWVLDLELTTTLYPVEAIESLELSIAVTESRMSLLPADEVAVTMDVGTATNIQLRWFYSDGPYDDDVAVTFGAEDGSYVQLRWFYTDGPYDDDVAVTFDVGAASNVNKLIEADAGIEELQLSIAIDTNSTMDLI